MKHLALCCICILLFSTPAGAHHGVASLGAAGLEGPGAPIETSSSATLPAGGILIYSKLDFARFDLFTPAIDDEGDYNAFWIYGAGYGATPYLSLYLFLPYYTKKLENNSYNTSGFADMSVMGVLGFKYDRGIMLTPPNESLDDMEDWHFTLYAGLTLPTGDENIRDAGGAIDPGMSLGFGTPSFSGGFTATKPVSGRLTLVFDASAIRFVENEYDDGARIRFGDEFRINTALSLKMIARAKSQFRLDGNIEANYLGLGRDEADGAGEAATGGSILYLVPGFRFYYKSASLGLGVKLPAYTDLNEDADQQGAEGKERYRALVTLSVLL